MCVCVCALLLFLLTLDSRRAACACGLVVSCCRSSRFVSFLSPGKHVCISLSAARGGDASGTQRLLLSHVATPHVLLASAVAASCAMPSIMRQCKLEAKDPASGAIVPFEVGVVGVAPALARPASSHAEEGVTDVRLQPNA